MSSEHSGTSSPVVPGPSAAPTGRPPVRQLVSSLVVNLVVPVVGYFLLRPHVSGDTLALGLVAAIPVVRTLAVLVWRRRVDLIGVLAAIGLALAVLISLFSGGGSLPIKFNEAMLTGVLGAACLISVAVGKPLHMLLMKPPAGQPLPPQALQTSRFVTLVMGVTFLLHATVHVVFALTLSTGSFLIASRVVGWIVILLGGGVVYLYVQGKKKRRATVGRDAAGSTAPPRS